MSGIAGIVRFDRTPVEPSDLDAMSATLAHRGPDGIRRRVDGPVGMAHAAMHTTVQDAHSEQPLVDPSGRRCVALDGHVDNRAELRAALGPRREALRDDSDAELVLAAYDVFGTAAFGRIVGDFALALWDGVSHELLLARDFLGKRPLHYIVTPSQLRWASEPQAVLADPTSPRRVDVGMVAEVLAGEITSRTDTLFLDVKRLAPAHHLVASERGVRVERSWQWDPGHEVRYRDDREYVEHFRSLFTDVVAGHLTSPHPVAAELSGGVDSSSIVGTAARLHRDGTVDGSLEVFSMVFPGRPCDESTYIRAVAEHAGVRVHEHAPGPAGLDAYREQIRRHETLPDAPNMMMHRSHLQAARALGCRVVLTGQGGDEWLTGSPLAYADALRGLRFRELRRSAGPDREVWGLPSRTRQLLRHGIRPLLPARLERLARRRSGQDALPPWIRPELAREVALADRIREEPVRGARLAARDLARSLENGWLLHGTEAAERTMAVLGLEHRTPFDDRRLVELALALPDEVRRRRGAYKWVLRVAMEDRLPELVRLRGDKADFSHIFLEELAGAGGREAFRGLELEKRGWIDGAALRQAHDRLESPDFAGFGGPEMWPLWFAVCTEEWIRAMFPSQQPLES